MQFGKKDYWRKQCYGGRQKVAKIIPDWIVSKNTLIHSKRSHIFYTMHVEATARGYNFDASKLYTFWHPQRVQAITGQMEFELEHLLRKLKQLSIIDIESKQRKITPSHHKLKDQKELPY